MSQVDNCLRDVPYKLHFFLPTFIAVHGMAKSPCCVCNAYLCLVLCDHSMTELAFLGGIGTDTDRLCWMLVGRNTRVM